MVINGSGLLPGNLLAWSSVAVHQFSHALLVMLDQSKVVKDDRRERHRVGLVGYHLDTLGLSGLMASLILWLGCFGVIFWQMRGLPSLPFFLFSTFCMRNCNCYLQISVG